jgi:hypothetical protein
MSRRATRPLNPNAVQAADDEIYQRHEAAPRANPLYDAAGNRLSLSATDPTQTDLRREWMDLYIENGGQVKETSPDPTPPGQVVTICPGTPSPSPPPTPPPPPITEPPVPLAVNKPAPTTNLHVQLQHACDNSPLNNGNVEISGPESRNLPAGANGWAKFEGITPGNYTIKSTHPQHYPRNAVASVPEATTTEVKLPLQATIEIASAQPAYTVVLDKNGNPTAAFPILQFNIAKGPPNHLFAVQLSRDGAASFTGGPGLAKSWVQADGRDGRMKRTVFSSWANGQKTLKLDGSGNATFSMPLEWWRDQARQKLPDFKDFTYSFRVVAFKSASTPVCAYSATSSVVLHNNLVKAQVKDNGYTNGGLAHSVQLEFTVLEANTMEMYTMVQWMQGSFKEWSGTPPVMRFTPGHKLYGITHFSNFADFTVDRLRTDPRYRDGNFQKTPDGLTAFTDDAPSAPLNDGFSHGWDSVDFETRVHLNFEVPANVKITRKDGVAPNIGVITGVLENPQPITLTSNTWKTRVLQIRQPDGTVTADNTKDNFAGP